MYLSNGTWDPQLWYYNRKSSDTPTENGPRTSESSGGGGGGGSGSGGDNNHNNNNNRRRSGDPRERLRKEQDGIVLSPQRRSFISGCFVPGRDATRTNTNRPHSPSSLANKTETSHISGNNHPLKTTRTK